MKKLLMKWFPGFFQVIKLIDTRNDLGEKNPFQVVRVVEPEEDGDNLHTALGVTLERFEELLAMVRKSINDNNNTVDVMEDISGKAKHANEFFLMNVMMMKEINRMQSGGGILGAIIAASLKDRGNDND